VASTIANNQEPSRVPTPGPKSLGLNQIEPQGLSPLNVFDKHTLNAGDKGAKSALLSALWAALHLEDSISLLYLPGYYIW
jgi:hypothetical protein